MSDHAKSNPDADAAPDNEHRADDAVDGGDSDDGNAARPHPKQSREKADPTVVPKSGKHWQHDVRGEGASSSRGGKGRSLFDAGERGGKSGGKTEEKWLHDKFESPSLSEARPVSAKGKGRQNPPSSVPPPASTDVPAAAERAPRHIKGDKSSVAALAAAANTLSVNDAPEDAAPRARAVRGRDLSRGAAAAGGHRRGETSSSSGASASLTSAAEYYPAGVATRGRGGGASRGGALASRGGSAQRVYEHTYSVGADDAPPSPSHDASATAEYRGPPRGRGGRTVVFGQRPVSATPPQGRPRHNYDIDAPLQAQDVANSPEFVPGMHYNPRGPLGPGFSPAAPSMPYAFPTPEMQQYASLMAMQQQQQQQQQASPGAMRQFYPPQYYMQGGGPVSTVAPGFENQAAMYMMSAANGQAMPMLMYNGGQMYYMQGSVAGAAGRSAQAGAAPVANAPHGDAAASLRSSSSPPPSLKPEAKPFVPPPASK